MNNIELLSMIRQDVQAALAPDKTHIEGAALAAYLSRLETLNETDASGLDQFEIERLKAGKDFEIENLRQDRASDLEMFRSVIAAGQAALKAAMSVNGAAATAILAFSAHLLSKGGQSGVIASMALPMLLFVGGVLTSTAAYGVNYVTQCLCRCMVVYGSLA